MRAIHRRISLFLFVAGGCTSPSVIAQIPSQSPSVAVQTDSTPDVITSSLPETPVSSTSSIQAELPALAERPSYLLVDAPSGFLARENQPGSYDSTAGARIMIAPTQRPLKPESEIRRNTDCEDGVVRGKPCRVSWLRVLGESFIFLFDPACRQHCYGHRYPR